MNNFTFKDSNGVNYRRVTKSQAKKIYDSGVDVVLCPNNLKPFCFWNPEIVINNMDFIKYGYTEPIYLNGVSEMDFRKRVNNFEFYNCINSETGLYTAFYIAIQN